MGCPSPLWVVPPWTGRPGFYKKKVELTMRSKSVNSIPSWPLHQLQPPVSCLDFPQWWQINPFLSSLPLVLMFITTIKIRLECPARQVILIICIRMHCSSNTNQWINWTLHHCLDQCPEYSHCLDQGSIIPCPGLAALERCLVSSASISHLQSWVVTNVPLRMIMKIPWG